MRCDCECMLTRRRLTSSASRRAAVWRGRGGRLVASRRAAARCAASVDHRLDATAAASRPESSSCASSSPPPNVASRVGIRTESWRRSCSRASVGASAAAPSRAVIAPRERASGPAAPLIGERRRQLCSSCSAGALFARDPAGPAAPVGRTLVKAHADAARDGNAEQLVHLLLEHQRCDRAAR